MQASFIDTYAPQMVTVGIGGNDVGLMGKLRVCAMPGVCEWASGNGLQETAGEIKGLFDHLTVLYDKLAALSPTTRIYAIGYSDIITPNGVCDPITALLFSREERVYMQESTRYLNEVIAAAAMKSGIGYIDIQEAFDGHKLCDSFTSSAMNGFVLGDDVPLIASLPLLKLVGAGSFHPKPAGHQMIADDITRAHPPLNFYSWCPNQAVRCPHDVLPPEASTYWQVVADKSAPRATIGSFATEIPHASQRLHISLPASSSLPNSEVKIELRSDSIALGSLRSDSRGGVDGEVVVPLSVPIGYHTLHLLGSSFDGSAIDVYQFLTIGADAELLPALSGDSIVPTEPNQTSSDDGAEQLTGGISALEIQGGATGDTAVLGAHVVQKPIIGTGLSFMTTPIKGQYHTIARYLHRHGWIFMCVAGIVLAVCVIIVFLIRSRWSKRGGSV